jgi:hypothetical protein
MTEETVKEFEEKCKQIKQNQEEYFQLITSGHCAVCLAELNVEPEVVEVSDTLTCSVCAERGWDKIFMMGVMVGRELKDWKKRKVK